MDPVAEEKKSKKNVTMQGGPNQKYQQQKAKAEMITPSVEKKDARNTFSLAKIILAIRDSEMIILMEFQIYQINRGFRQHKVVKRISPN